MEAPTVRIMTPCYGGNVTADYLHSIFNSARYCAMNGISLSINTVSNCSLICLGRSTMLSQAMKDESWTHVMWIDSDLRFEPEYIHSMIVDDKDIIGGFYPKKGLPIDFASSPMPGGEETEFLFETMFVATGFMLIKRKVVEHMMEHYKEELTFKYQGFDDYVDLFGPIIDKDRQNLYLTEDYAFCYRARQLGYKTFMSKRFELPHFGQMAFSARHEEAMLEDYEKQGRITINRDHKPLYFSGYAEPLQDD